LPQSIAVADTRKSLVERVAGSRYLSRSARLRDLLLYLSDRVLDEHATEIHEQEVGHKVFGRSKDYDTSSDNIVRVHASMLRKRLDQYFAAEGAGEPLILEIPKGNYAPAFRMRAEPEIETPPASAPSGLDAAPEVIPLPPVESPARRNPAWLVGALAFTTVLFAGATLFLALRPGGRQGSLAALSAPSLKLLWSSVFQPGRATDIVLDDAGVALYQELTGKRLLLSEYFDRSYLRGVPAAAAQAGLNERAASAIVLRRHSNFADANLLWKLFQMPGGESNPNLRFARDYSFRELKADDAILLGNSQSNPWVEPFEAKLGLRWVFDSAADVYYPVDSWTGNKSYLSRESDSHEGYCGVSLLPNLGGSGNVLLIAGTGGSAVNACAAFLADEQAVSGLRRRLPPARDKAFPYFEALIQVKGRSASVRDSTIVIARSPR